MSKVQSQQTIARLIEQNQVTNQPQLVELLAGEGITATQATVSRDLEDLGAVKVRVPGGATVYAVPEFAPERVAPLDHLRRVMGEWVAEVTSSGNLVVVRTPPGCAHVVASALDRSGLEGLLGTVAGDDTMLCVATEPAGGERLADTLRDLAGIESNGPGLMSGSTLWHGRFEGGPNEALMAYTASLPFDRRLWRDDIAGSRAHVRGLARVGLISSDECDAILAALDQVEREIGDGSFAFVEADEDIHTAVERRVTELAGAAGAKLHTARSRNDQVATDLRLWCKRELVGVARAIHGLQSVLLRTRRRRRRHVPAGLHPPAAGAAGAARPSPARARMGIRPRRRPPARHGAPARRLAARRRRAGRHVAADRSVGHGRRARLRGAPSTTRSTPSATATSSPRRCSTWR